MIDEAAAKSKKRRLLSGLGKLDSLMVAFSGGVDSAFLLTAATEALGEKVVAATAVSTIHPRREQDAAVSFARKRHIGHVLVQTDEIEISEFAANGIDRCYHCKKALSIKLFQMAEEKAINHVAHGANIDDLDDYRPGFRAAQEAGLIAPLVDVGLGKEEIRFLAKGMGLSEWDKPAMACLATRVPYGSVITEKKLNMVEAAEEFLLTLDTGFRGLRVRHHGAVARIEADPVNFGKIVSEKIRTVIVERLCAIGFEHVSLDLEEIGRAHV